MFPFLALFLALPARAQEITVNVDPDVADQLGLDPEQVAGILSGDITDALRLDDPSGFLDAMASAAAFSAKGMGVDYASSFEHFELGASMGTGVNAAGVTFVKGDEPLPEAGFAFQLSLMAGLSLGFGCSEKCFWDRFRIFVNGMQLDTGGEPFEGQLTNLGAHLQVQLLQGIDAEVLRWGGIAVTTGYELTDYRLELARSLPVASSSGGVELGWDATGTYTLASNTTSIPVELSSNLRVLFATAYAGAGLDLVQGSATSDVRLSGDITAEAEGEELRLGDATVRYGGRGHPAEQVPRAFAGLQFNALMAKVYGQVNIGLDRSFGGNFGLRLVF